VLLHLRDMQHFLQTRVYVKIKVSTFEFKHERIFLLQMTSGQGDK